MNHYLKELDLLPALVKAYDGRTLNGARDQRNALWADAQTMVSIAPHMALMPGFAIILTVLGLNLMGGGLRDLLDPRLRVART